MEELFFHNQIQVWLLHLQIILRRFLLVSRTIPVIQPSTSNDASLVDVIEPSTLTGHVAKKKSRPFLKANVKAYRAA